MAELTLVNAIFSLGLIGITGAFAYALKKIGAIALWGIASSLILVSLTFNWGMNTVIGLAVISLLISVITVIFDG